MSFILFLCFFVILLRLSNQQSIYLFNTEDNDNVEYYDCVIVDGVPYCRRSDSPISLHRENNNSSCQFKGKVWSFEELRRANRTPTHIIHNFRSSIEKAEEYSFYLSGHENSSFLCECQKRSFGKNCEYQIHDAKWLSLPTFVEIQNWQNQNKKQNRFRMHVYQKTPCYTTLVCDYGLLCLDWRDICDGRQQCMDGWDEEACDLLEFNECERDEYRCSNGMCIPDIYFLDGEYDCMDYSDEHRLFNHSECAYQPDPLNCDEHACSLSEWSCGDGQCIDERNRYKWQESIIPSTQCYSMREYMFMCELSDRYNLWTMVNGTCYHSSVAPLIDLSYKREAMANQITHEYCEYLVKCALSKGAEKNCPCGKSDCSRRIIQNCSSAIQYPLKGLLTPYLITHYNKTRDWFRKKQPDFYMLSGSIRCRGYQAYSDVNGSIWFENTTDLRHIALARAFCEHQNISKNTAGPQFHPLCYTNASTTLGKESSYAFVDVCEQCISQYRINDGSQDCINGEDESPEQIDTCTGSISHHRYRCPSGPDTCLIVKALGDSITSCNQGEDEFTFGSGQSLSMIKCRQSEDEDCLFLREYIFTSGNNSDSNTQTSEKTRLSFRSYCNTFWDLKDQTDELLKSCRSWRCPRDEYRCRTGQCIPLNYVCDGEWDCFDASDELFEISDLSNNNQRVNLTEKQIACASNINRKTEAFSALCNISTEYPCLLVNFTRQSDISYTRPCININQIGDKKVDCLGGLDERNTLKHCNGFNQLGHAFQCRSESDMCIDEHNLCSSTGRCPDSTDISPLCGQYHDHCSHSTDFVCFNETCARNGRCNGKIDCQYGEDEYWCNPQASSRPYRILKHQTQLKTIYLCNLPRHPLTSSRINNSTIEKPKPIVKRNIPINIPANIVPMICNRGVAVLDYTNTTVCFCPPSYYGRYCEYHGDRVTIYTHLDVSHSRHAQITVDSNITIKVLALLLYENQILHNRQFHFRSADDFHRILKKRCHLIYSREKKLLQAKMHRRSNRTSIVNHTVYSIQYEAYELTADNSINFLGVWQYPIYFDFLPSFRIAKTLRFDKNLSQSSDSSCHPNLCNSSNAEYHILQNDPKKYICLCKSGYSGQHCSIRDPYCANNFCHSKSLCKPTYLGNTAGTRLPYCLCPLNVYGSRCGLVFDQCWDNPCRNNGTCYSSTSDLNKTNCACSKKYYGDYCQVKTEDVDIAIYPNNVSGILVIQYFYINFKTLDLILGQQQVVKQLPGHLRYEYPGEWSPDIILLRSYSTANDEYPKIFLLSLTIKKRGIKSSTSLTDENTCLNVKDMFSNISVYQYHNICRDSLTFPDLLCFFDDQYLCFCEAENYRAECFGYNHTLDQCKHCLSKGRCVQGDPKKESDYVCLCVKCHYGPRCQYSSEHYSFTLGQVFKHSLLSTTTTEQKIAFYSAIIIPCIFFFIGAFNNLFTFVTFYRSKLLRSGVGNYLLVGSMVNQLTLFFLAFRLIHIVLRIAGSMATINMTINKVLCKTLSFALISSSQLSYWLMSIVAIERLYITWCIKGTWLKKPYVARRIMCILTTSILLINAPQIVFYTTIIDTETAKNSSICVILYPHSFWMYLNLVNNYINTLLPLLINIFCTTGIMCLIARQKLLANQKSDSIPPTTITNTEAALESNEVKVAVENESTHPPPSNIDGIDQRMGWYIKAKTRWNFFRTIFHENIELIFGPAITILPQLFSLPQIIISSIMICRDFGSAAIRYPFIISFLISFAPQTFSFLLYVRSSSVYYARFRSTVIGRKIMSYWNCCHRETKARSDDSEPSQYVLSNTIHLLE